MGCRVQECKVSGVQRLPRKGPDCRGERLGQPVRLAAESGAVVGVADQRVADMRHVDADLVGAPGFEPAFDEGCLHGVGAAFGEFLQHGEMRDRVAGTTARRTRSAARPSGASTVPVMRGGMPHTSAW